MKHGVIYKITNLVNGKIYIGQTITPLKERWYAHTRSARKDKPWTICRAIRKYGKESFKMEEIDFATCKDSLNELEIHYIENLKPQYNMCKGGGGLGSPTDEVRKKISEAGKGRKLSEEARKANSARQKGHVVSIETRLKLSIAQKGRKYPHRQNAMSKEECQNKRNEKYILSFPEEVQNHIRGLSKNERIAYRANLNFEKNSERVRGINNPMYGKRKSDEEKQNLSEKLKGEKNPYYGKKHSEEALNKMRLAHTNRPNIKCPHCPMSGIVSNMKRWHFDNCKAKT
jgi:group I intron endonuclease